jgi:hypothetical protein
VKLSLCVIRKEGKAQDLPVANAETGDTVCHLDNDELATALHLACFTLPDLMIVSCESSD